MTDMDDMNENMDADSKAEKRARFSRKAKFYTGGLIIWVAVALIIGISFQKGLELLQPVRVAVDHSQVAHLQHEIVAFPSRDGAETIAGWHISAEDSDKTVIFTHSFGSNRAEKQVPAIALAEDLVAEGYNVLLFDFRRSGESTGATSTIGYLEQLDILGAMDYILEQDSNQQIAVYGFAMGASATIMLGSAEQRFVGIIADSPFAHLTDYLMDNMSKWTGYPTYPFSWFIIGTMPIVTGLDPEGVSPVSVVSEYQTPMLFLHGEADEVIPPQSSFDIAEAAPPGIVTVKTFPGAGHLQSYSQDRDTYLAEVFSFLEDVFE